MARRWRDLVRAGLSPYRGGAAKAPARLCLCRPLSPAPRLPLHSVEDTIYVAPQAQGRGIGRASFGARRPCEALGFRQMIAVIGDGRPDSASVGLHKARLPHSGTIGLRLQARAMARHRPHAAGAQRRRDTAARSGQHGRARLQGARRQRLKAVTSFDQLRVLSKTRSTRASSCPRLRIRPVAATTRRRLGGASGAGP